MENASKALIIAGSILISILVISLLVMFYDDIKSLMRTEQNVELFQQVEEFNKQYDVYYRDNLYGSDILSLANKVYDYNIRESQEQGYLILEVQVKFKNKITTYDKIDIIDIKKKYTASELKKIIDDLDDKILELGNATISGKKVSYLSGFNSMQLREILGNNYNRNMIDNYVSYKSALTTLKSKTFKATKFEYDNNTGRIVKMIFEEN